MRVLQKSLSERLVEKGAGSAGGRGLFQQHLENPRGWLAECQDCTSHRHSALLG